MIRVKFIIYFKQKVLQDFYQAFTFVSNNGYIIKIISKIDLIKYTNTVIIIR